MATLDAYYSIRAPLITISKILGLEIWTSDKKFQPASYYLMATMAFYNVCNAYTIVTRATDPVKWMQITILFGIATQLIFKYFYAISKKYAFRELFNLAEENIYRRYSTATIEENHIIKKTVRYLKVTWKICAAMYSSTLMVFGAWPLYVYYTDGQLVPLFMYELPMVDTENWVGYSITLFIHIEIYVLGILGLVLADFVFIFIAIHAMASVDLFIIHTTEMKNLLTAEKLHKDPIEIANKWKCCMKDHQFATSYLNAIEDVTGLLCLIQVISCVYTICDGMLLVALTDWYAAYCFIVVIFGGMSVYFITGHFVELKVDELYESIMDFPWNLLNLPQQKEYSYLLARSQRPLTLTIYGFAPLNLDSYTTVLKSLYQYFVMVIQYLR